MVKGANNKKTKRAKKDKEESKRFSYSGFAMYGLERSDSLKKEKPELDKEEYYKIILEEWNSFSDEKKKSYIAKGKADAKKYEAEKKVYEKKKIPEPKKALKNKKEVMFAHK